MKVEITRDNGDVVALSENEVLHVINEWYTGGMVGRIFQDEDGRDLEEILDIDSKVQIRTVT